MTKLEAALDAARRGFSVFPLVPNAKTPALKNWQNLATTDKTQLEAWWAQWPEANIGITTERLLVVDIDPRNGGDATAQRVHILDEFPKTRCSRTGGGGSHMLYALPDHTVVRGGAGKLGDGVDIKSWGGYIVGPGSTANGNAYSWLNDRPVAPAPQWLIDRCKAAKPKSDSAGKRVTDENAEAIDRAFAWIATRAPSAEKGNRGYTAYQVACRLYELGVSRATCVELLGEWSTTRCDPPMDAADVSHAAESAEKNMQNPIGSKNSAAPGFDAVEIAEKSKPATALSNADCLATALEPFVALDIPPRPWVISGYACRARVTLLAGPGGVAKSTHTLMCAVALATGRDDICGFPIPKRSRVWLWNQEDDLQEMQRRLAAIMEAFDVTWDHLRDENGPMLYVDSGVDTPLMLAKRTMEQTIIGTKQVGQVISAVRDRKIDLLVLDPLVEFHEAGENDNVQMRAVVGQVRRIAVEGDCAVLLAAHTRKPPQAAADGFAGEMDAARGASSQLGVVRIGATIFSMSPKMAKEWKVSGEPSDYVRIDIAKNNMARPRPDPIWFKRASVLIGGESVGLLRPIELVRKAGTHESLAELVAEAIATKLSRGIFYSLSRILSHIPDEKHPLFGSKKNQGAKIKEEFDDRADTLTKVGKLTGRFAAGVTSRFCLERGEEEENTIESSTCLDPAVPPSDVIREEADYDVDNAE